MPEASSGLPIYPKHQSLSCFIHIPLGSSDPTVGFLHGSMLIPPIHDPHRRLALRPPCHAHAPTGVFPPGSENQHSSTNQSGVILMFPPTWLSSVLQCARHSADATQPCALVNLPTPISVNPIPRKRPNVGMGSSRSFK